MLSHQYITCLPAYGRDYNSQRAAKADWEAGKDFRDASTGSYLSIRDAQQHGLKVMIRYSKGRKIMGV